ncbi:hypothetical protein [Leifsonia sp. NPDC058230]|uniref:hypothetical protein n=1 Tax=Leifsonia sp. NPDC058230 TaxID=3346391 RepID=UPI0036DE6D92
MAGPARILGSSGLVVAAVTGILTTVALLPGTGSYALWNGAAVTDAGTVTAGTVAVAETVTPSLDVVFTSGRTTSTGGVLVTNTSTVATTFTSAVTLVPGSSAPLAAAISLVAWPTANTASCTTGAAVPSDAYTGTWSSVVAATGAGALTGTLAPGASFAYCLRSTMNVAAAAGITSGSLVSLSFTTRVSAGTTWSAVATTTASQSFVDSLVDTVEP